MEKTGRTDYAGFLEKESGVTPTVVDEINKAIEICLKVGYSFNNPTQYQIGMLMDCIMMMSADVNELNYAEFINATRVMIETTLPYFNYQIRQVPNIKVSITI